MLVPRQSLVTRCKATISLDYPWRSNIQTVRDGKAELEHSAREIRKQAGTAPTLCPQPTKISFLPRGHFSTFKPFREISSSDLDFQAAQDCNHSSPNTGSPMRLGPVSKTGPQQSGFDASRTTTLSSRCLKVEQKGAPTC